MTRLFLKSFFITGIILLFFSNGYTEDLNKVFMSKGYKAFVSKDFPVAIQNFKKVLENDRSDDKARKLLVKSYYNHAQQLFDKKEYEDSRETLYKLFEYDKQNKAARILARKITQKIGAPLRGDEAVATEPGAGGGGSDLASARKQKEKELAQRYKEIDLDKTFSPILQAIGQSNRLLAESIEQSNALASDQTKQNAELIKLLAEQNQVMNTQSREMGKHFQNMVIVVIAVALGVLILIGIIGMLIARMFIKANVKKTQLQQESLESFIDKSSAELGGTKTTGEYLEDLKSKDDFERAAAVEGLMEWMDPTSAKGKEIIDAVKPLLEEKSPRVRGNAAMAMHKVEPEVAISTLSQMCDSGDKRQITSAMWVLGEIASKEAMDILLKFADSEDDIINGALLIAMQKVSSTEVFEMNEDEKTRVVNLIKKLNGEE